MRKICFAALFVTVLVSVGWADTLDTAVFKGTMLPGNEVPAVAVDATSALATITVRVTRDVAWNVNAATVMFDIGYTVAVATSFTGLHIHNAPAGVNGPVVINTGISGTTAVSAAAGSGRIFRTVNYGSTDTDGLKFVTGLLAAPENYYANIHSTTFPGGLMRAQLQRTSAIFRPPLSPLQENPALSTLDAEGAALIEVRVNRDAAGAINSGAVTFDVDYRFGSAVTITGMHIHQAVAGQNGAVVIDSGINGSSRAISGATRGNIYRVVDIDSSNAAGLQVLAGLLANPTGFYINLHTTDNPGGAIRGQLSSNVYAFFNQMTGAEENPPTTTSGAANSITIVRVDRDSTGNITNGVVSFNAVFNMGGAVTFTGWHIHNGKIGVNGGVVINTGLSGTSTVVDDDGIGSITRDVTIDGTNANTLNALRGVIANPEAYYVNLHTTTNPGGIIRAQLTRETYHFKTTMTGANEVAPVATDATATGRVTVQISRDANGVINGGKVTFDVDHVVNGATTFTGLHIHSGAAGVNGGVVINTGLSGSNSVSSATGSGNISRTVNITSTDTAQLAMLDVLANSPDQAYINLHTTTNPGGLIRSQMMTVANYVAQAAGGGDWITSITIRNPSSSVAVHGIVDFFKSLGPAMDPAITDPSISFVLPPSGSATFNLHNKGTLTVGDARIYSNGDLAVDVDYSYPAFTTPVRTTTAVGRVAILPVRLGVSFTENTGVAVLNLRPATIVLTLRDQLGAPVATASVPAPAGVQFAAFVRELLPATVRLPFSGALTIDSIGSSGPGQFAVMGIQFDGGMSPIAILAVP